MLRFVATLFTLATLASFHATADSLPTSLPVTKPTVTSPDQFNLDDYKGKVVYLDFWASWCGPCKFSFPYMEHLDRLYNRRDLVVITDNLDHSSAKAQEFVRELRTRLPVIYDSEGVLATRFDVSDMPTSILIDRDGKVRYTHKGFFKDKESEYTSHIVELLNETHLPRTQP